LSDRHSLPRWQQDPTARRATEILWRYDPDPAATLAIQSQINTAVAAVAVAVADETPRGHRHYNCCPWSTVYQVRHPVVIAGQPLRPMQEFVLDVSAEEMLCALAGNSRTVCGQSPRLLQPHGGAGLPSSSRPNQYCFRYSACSRKRPNWPSTGIRATSVSTDLCEFASCRAFSRTATACTS